MDTSVEYMTYDLILCRLISLCMSIKSDVAKGYVIVYQKIAFIYGLHMYIYLWGS